MVEAGRVELPSENVSPAVSTSLVCGLKFPSEKRRKQSSSFGSFIGRGMRKALHAHVHRASCALISRRGNGRRTAALIRQRKLIYYYQRLNLSLRFNVVTVHG